MGGGWKIAIALLLLAAIAAVLWGRQGASEEAAQGALPRVVKPDGSTRTARERPGREREERPGGTPEKK